MRDALLKGCTHSTEASQPQPSGYTPINAQNIVRDFGVGGMGRRESAATWARLGSAAWAVGWGQRYGPFPFPYPLALVPFNLDRGGWGVARRVVAEKYTPP